MMGTASANKGSYATDFVALFVTAMTGLLIAGYLLSEEQSKDSNEPRVCDLNSVVSCSRVLDSPFAELFGVPIAALGVSWYLVLVWAAYLLLTASPISPELVLLVLAWCAAGCVFVVYLLLVELYLGAICPLCTIIHILTFTHSALAVRVLRRLLAEKTHLRLSDLVHAAIAASKPWLLRIAVLFVLPIIYTTVMRGLVAGRDLQLADALGVDSVDRVNRPVATVPNDVRGTLNSSFVDQLASVTATRVALNRTEQINLLIDCFHAKNVHMYGSQFCSHCHKQRELFLPVILPETVYVECVRTAPAEGNKAPAHVPNPECNRLNVTGYPTWIQFADDSFHSEVIQHKSGVTQLAELARRYDCGSHKE